MDWTIKNGYPLDRFDGLKNNELKSFSLKFEFHSISIIIKCFNLEWLFFCQKLNDWKILNYILLVSILFIVTKVFYIDNFWYVNFERIGKWRIGNSSTMGYKNLFITKESKTKINVKKY